MSESPRKQPPEDEQRPGESEEEHEEIAAEAEELDRHRKLAEAAREHLPEPGEIARRD
jgi:hypothetical protein